VGGGYFPARYLRGEFFEKNFSCGESSGGMEKYSMEGNYKEMLREEED